MTRRGIPARNKRRSQRARRSKKAKDKCRCLKSAGMLYGATAFCDLVANGLRGHAENQGNSTVFRSKLRSKFSIFPVFVANSVANSLKISDLIESKIYLFVKNLIVSLGAKTRKTAQKPRKINGFWAIFMWSEWRDLNPRPLGPEPSTLPSALHPEKASVSKRPLIIMKKPSLVKRFSSRR